MLKIIYQKNKTHQINNNRNELGLELQIIIYYFLYNKLLVLKVYK